ncbi:hypothetical protein ZOSMA_62G00460 [Zostera marina]|uniref:Uncharacterized protein n=1 Tax=Zostera marina TaxID=29655 RepID=A0A0K9NT77_ZOSMR|nr:hypothetical protein ZOSMA_62G00460 [Zostera marina]
MKHIIILFRFGYNDIGILRQVSIFPFVYTSDGPSQEVSNRRLFQPTLMEFIHCTRIRKKKSILRKCREDLAVRKTSYAGDIVDTIEPAKPLISSPQPSAESDVAHVLKSSTNQSICPPSFELLDQSYMDVCDNSQPSVVSNFPVRVVTNSGTKASTPYTYSKSNLIFVVEEGQSMYSQLFNDVRYSKISGTRPNGIAYTQLRLNKDYMSPEKTTEILNDMRTPLLNVGNSQSNSIFISSPDFWASAVASADVLENTVNPPKIEDLSDVARRINFSQSDIISPESPYVSSTIKRVKDRRRYWSSSFYLIANDTVTCLGQHLNDILQDLVEVFFGVIRAELAEKCIHGSKFQFVNPELFDDEYDDRTSRVVPQLVNSRDVEIHAPECGLRINEWRF